MTFHSKKILLLAYIALLVSYSSAVIGEWTVWTNAMDSRCIVSDGRYAWFGTAGGVVRLNPDNNEYTVFTNIDGIEGLDIVSLTTDSSGYLWYAASNGYVGFFDGYKWQSSDDLSRNGYFIKNIRYGTGYLWICTSKGLIKAEPVPDFFTVILFKEYIEFIADLPAQSPTYDVVTKHDSIFLATDFGVICASLKSSLLISSNWKVLPLIYEKIDTSGTEVLHLHVTSLTFHHDELWAGQYTKDTPSIWKLTDRFVPVCSTFTVSEPHIQSIDDTLWVLNKYGMNYYNEASGDFRSIPNDAPFPTFTGIAKIGDKKLVSGSYGYSNYYDSELHNHFLNIPWGSNFSDVTFNEPYVIVTTATNAVNIWDGENWRFIDFRIISSGYPSDIRNKLRSFFGCILTAAMDDRGTIWLGSWGLGILRIFSNLEFEFWTVENSDLSSSDASANFPVVTFLRRDPNGNIWVANLNSIDSKPLKVWTSNNVDDPYGSIGFSFPIPNGQITDLKCKSDRVSIATIDGGAIIIHQGTLTGADHSSDDINIKLYGELPQKSLLSTTIDIENKVWFGSTDGLVYYDPMGFIIEVPMPDDLSSMVTSLSSDSYGNIWIGTTEGAAVLMPDGFYSTFKSTFSPDAPVSDRTPLISDRIGFEYGIIPKGGIFTDGVSGDIWFCFEEGAVVLHSTYDADTTVTDLIVYPNPVIADRGILPTIHIGRAAADASLSIYSSSGQIVRHFERYWKGHDGVFLWDAKNESGELVAPGIYIFVASSDKGVAKSKVLIIR